MNLADIATGVPELYRDGVLVPTWNWQLVAGKHLLLEMRPAYFTREDDGRPLRGKRVRVTFRDSGVGVDAEVVSEVKFGDHLRCSLKWLAQESSK